MNNKNKILVVLILFSPISLIYWLGGEWQVMVVFLISSIVSILIMNSDKIKAIGVGKDNVSLELKDIKEMTEKVNKANEELNVTIDQLNNTITPLLDFSLGLLAKDGEFDGVTKFEYIEPFLYSSIDMYLRMDNMSLETKKLLDKGFQNLVLSLSYEVTRLIPNIQSDFRKWCQSYPVIKINYGELQRISSDIGDNELEKYYLNLIHRLERYENYYEEKIRGVSD